MPVLVAVRQTMCISRKVRARVLDIEPPPAPRERHRLRRDRFDRVADHAEFGAERRRSDHSFAGDFSFDCGFAPRAWILCPSCCLQNSLLTERLGIFGGCASRCGVGVVCWIARQRKLCRLIGVMSRSPPLSAPICGDKSIFC